MTTRIIRLPEVMLKTGMSRSTVYELEGFPKPVKLGRNMSGWVESEIDAWIAARISARDAMDEHEQVPRAA